jgi:DNA-binding GntR family transcriptional regulator
VTSINFSGAMSERRGPEFHTLEDYAHHALKQAILSQQLAPGEEVTLQSLEEALGVSRTPIRQAVRRLAASGFISMLPHTTLRVRELDVAEARELYRIRRPLEVIAVAQAIERRTDEDVALLEEALSASERAYEAAEPWEIITANRMLHRRLYAPCAMPILLGVIEDLSDRCERYRWTEIVAQATAAESRRQHRDLVAAARDRDARLAETLVERHLDLAEQTVVAALERDG